MRRWITIAVLVLCSISAVLAQDTTDEGARKVEERFAPAYPDLARKLSMEGLVRLRVTVSAEGGPKEIDVLGGNPVLVKAAQDAVARWKWAPAARETKEVIEVRFHPKR